MNVVGDAHRLLLSILGNLSPNLYKQWTKGLEKKNYIYLYKDNELSKWKE